MLWDAGGRLDAVMDGRKVGEDIGQVILRIVRRTESAVMYYRSVGRSERDVVSVTFGDSSGSASRCIMCP